MMGKDGKLRTVTTKETLETYKKENQVRHTISETNANRAVAGMQAKSDNQYKKDISEAGKDKVKITKAKANRTEREDNIVETRRENFNEAEKAQDFISDAKKTLRNADPKAIGVAAVASMMASRNRNAKNGNNNNNNETEAQAREKFTKIVSSVQEQQKERDKGIKLDIKQ